ncbi:DNA-binding protein [Klebsiella pneumoniae]|uniref:YobI family P-loop NTPase n=1 Tax=Klebsiella pneumoniae TaxID=573 RepID=UPI00286169B8|nr:DNA-binding protein [Klebsiella pneumoniae]MDR8609894.1 DNA-binding protein [Klebsiella pneumoniae]
MALLEKIKRHCLSKKVIDAHTDQQVGYDTLTPKIITDDSVKPYFDALDFAFTKQDVKNIAITGPYGAGKSTVILSYLQSRLKKDFITVSLADFSLSGKSDKNLLDNSEIEMSILQQILYKENKDKLPDSRIDRIQNRNKKHVTSLFFTVLSVVAPLILLTTVVFPRKILSLFSLENGVLNTIINAYPERLIISIILSIISLFFIVRVASKAGIFDKKIKLSKIAFLQASADMSTQEPSSLLNNCLDEIVYFFSQSQYKIVVFEDLDRLGNTEVFIKLREINQIVNNNLYNSPVRFVYACRDDIFLGVDIRTKFFDFILPVIPVMDTRNAYTHLNNKLIDFPSNEKALLKQMSLYISDMRSLQNIVNEFNLFRKVVDDNKNHAKIFSLIFYKNTYAQDYNLTDKKTGVLYNFINDYRLRKLHESYFNSLDSKLQELNIKVALLKKESVNSDADLRKQIISRFISPQLWSLISFAKKNRHYSLNYDKYSPESFYQNESEFVSFFNNSAQSFIGYNNNREPYFVKIDTTHIMDEYNQRVNVVAEDKNNEYQIAIKSLEEIKENIRTRNAITLSELIKLIGWEKFKTIAENYIEKCDDRSIIDAEQIESIRDGFRFGGFEVLYYLLTNGYIMQDYMMFRSIFHQGSISVNDNDYIKAVGRYMSCEEVNRNFSLDNPGDVLTELIEQHYQYRNGAIHYQIVSYLFDNVNSSNNKTLSEMIAMIFRESSTDIISIFNILESRFYDPSYFNRLVAFALGENRYLDKMLTVLEEQDNNDIITSITTKMIALVSPSISIDQKNYQQYIVKQGFNLIAFVEDDDLPSFLNNIKQLGVVYKDISMPVTPSENQALLFIADNQMYSLDRINYRVVVAGLLQHENITCEQVDELPWSIIERYQLSSLKSYVNDNIDKFVQDIFIYSKENTEAIIVVLTHSDLSNRLKVEILKKMQFTVTNLDVFPERLDIDGNKISYHDLFFSYEHVSPEWEVLIDYICEDCDLKVLTEYLETHAQTLSQQELNLTDGDSYNCLYMKVICNDQLKDITYAAVLAPIYINVHYWDDRLSIANFSRLIKNNKVELNDESFKLAAQCFISNTEVKSLETETINTFVLWFSKFKEIFFAKTDYYLCEDSDNTLLEKMLTAINSSQQFTVKEKASLLYSYHESYDESFLNELTMPHETLIDLIALSTDDSFTIDQIVRLLKLGFRERTEIAHLTNELTEREFSKIFNQKSATLNPSKNLNSDRFLSALQQAGLIKRWSQREDGKYYVDCRYEEDESYL